MATDLTFTWLHISQNSNTGGDTGLKHSSFERSFHKESFETTWSSLRQAVFAQPTWIGITHVKIFSGYFFNEEWAGSLTSAKMATREWRIPSLDSSCQGQVHSRPLKWLHVSGGLELNSNAQNPITQKVISDFLTKAYIEKSSQSNSVWNSICLTNS